MSRPKILVTGATGKIGSEVISQLLAQGADVRAAVRARDDRSAKLEQQGAEIVVADLFDSAAMHDAFRGVGRAFFLPPFNPKIGRAAHIFADAARGANAESIVALTQWLAGPNHPAALTRQLHEMEQIFTSPTGTAVTVVAPGFFADNYLRLIGFAAHLGILPSLTGKSRNAPPSNEDIARVAVAALLDPAAHAGRFYRPTGPRLMSTHDMAASLTTVLGRKVRVLPMPMWLFLKAARMQKVPPSELTGFRYWVKDHREGAFELCGVTDHVKSATGQPPESFETIAARYAELPEARRGFWQSLRAFLDFNRTPLMPGYDLDRFDRENGITAPDNARGAMADPAWKAERQALVASRIGQVVRQDMAA